jgi:hypothetical protein
MTRYCSRAQLNCNGKFHFSFCAMVWRFLGFNWFRKRAESSVIGCAVSRWSRTLNNGHKLSGCSARERLRQLGITATSEHTTEFPSMRPQPDTLLLHRRCIIYSLCISICLIAKSQNYSPIHFVETDGVAEDGLLALHLHHIFGV